jgi:hypothetical protein
METSHAPLGDSQGRLATVHSLRAVRCGGGGMSLRLYTDFLERESSQQAAGDSICFSRIKLLMDPQSLFMFVNLKTSNIIST